MSVFDKASSLALWLIALIGVLVARRLHADWRQEWEAELRYREAKLVRVGQARRARAQPGRVLGCAAVATTKIGG